jgi:hypothetical protein
MSNKCFVSGLTVDADPSSPKPAYLYFTLVALSSTDQQVLVPASDPGTDDIGPQGGKAAAQGVVAITYVDTLSTLQSKVTNFAKAVYQDSTLQVVFLDDKGLL